MRRRILSITTVLLSSGAVVLPKQTQAQDAARASRDSTTDNLPRRSLHAPSLFGGWVAVARHSAYQTRTGVAGHRDFYLSNVRFGWALGGGDDPKRFVNGSYFIDVIPAALSTSMPEYMWNSECQPGKI